jgi:transposase
MEPPRRRADKRNGHGTSANDRPPIIRIISRDTGEQRLWGCDRADTRTGRALSAENVPADSAILSTAEWQSSHGSPQAHAPVCHRAREWVREAQGAGIGEGHCHPCEGAGAALRTYWRPLRGVHQQDLHWYVATDDAMVKAIRITPHLIRRMCVGAPALHTGYT